MASKKENNTNEVIKVVTTAKHAFVDLTMSCFVPPGNRRTEGEYHDALVRGGGKPELKRT